MAIGFDEIQKRAVEITADLAVPDRRRLPAAVIHRPRADRTSLRRGLDLLGKSFCVGL
jgi:hypothetical protein